MKKVLSKKTLIPFMALFLCAVVAFGTAAVSSQRSANINIYVNANDTVKKYEGSSEDAIFAGYGINAWGMDLGPEAVDLNKMTDAYFEINAQRILKMKPKMVRFMVQPYYLCFMDSPTAGEDEWNAAETGYKNANLNFNSAYMYNIWRYLEVYEAAGTQVFLDWGYSYIAPMESWFAIKDAPFNLSSGKEKATRSAPRNLKAFANNLAAFLKECEDRGFIGDTRAESTIQYVTFYNEVINTNSEFATFGDKRTYYTTMLKYCHEAMVAAGFRDANAIEDRDKHRVLICGIDSAINVDFNDNTLKFIYYLYDNAYEKGYCDLFDTHQYLYPGGDPKSRLVFGSDSEAVISGANNRWPMKYKGSLNFIMAEMGLSHEMKTTIAKKVLSSNGKTKFSGYQTPFNGTVASNVIGLSLGGALSAFDWNGFALYFPANAGFNNNFIDNKWMHPSRTDSNGGIENVHAGWGSSSILMRYVPDDAKVARSTVDDANKDSVLLATYMNGDETSIVAEFDYKSGFDYQNFKSGTNNYTRTVNVHLDGRTQNQVYYKYVYEHPEESFINSPEAMSMYDGNATLPDAVEAITVENGMLRDEISGNHCLVIYSTMEPAQQIGLTRSSRQISYSLANNTDGVKIEVDPDACVRLPSNAEFEFDIYRGVVDAYDTADAPAYLSDKYKKTYFNTDCFEYKASNGVTLSKREGSLEADGNSATSIIYKCDDDAKVGDTIAVRVKLKGNQNLSNMIGDSSKRLQVYDTDVYAVAIIKIVE